MGLLASGAAASISQWPLVPVDIFLHPQKADRTHRRALSVVPAVAEAGIVHVSATRLTYAMVSLFPQHEFQGRPAPMLVAEAARAIRRSRTYLSSIGHSSPLEPFSDPILLT